MDSTSIAICVHQFYKSFEVWSSFEVGLAPGMERRWKGRLRALEQLPGGSGLFGSMEGLGRFRRFSGSEGLERLPEVPQGSMKQLMDWVWGMERSISEGFCVAWSRRPVLNGFRRLLLAAWDYDLFLHCVGGLGPTKFHG